MTLFTKLATLIDDRGCGQYIEGNERDATVHWRASSGNCAQPGVGIPGCRVTSQLPLSTCVRGVTRATNRKWLTRVHQMGLRDAVSIIIIIMRAAAEAEAMAGVKCMADCMAGKTGLYLILRLPVRAWRRHCN